MQELTTPVPLTSPYASADGVTMPTAPRLGTPVPGTTGGLPAQQGLNVYSNPLAQQLQSNPDNFNPSMQTSQQPSDQYGAQQAPSAYPQELPLSREQAQSRQDQQPMQGYAHGGVAHSAEKVRAHGRGDDTVLIHMTPNEVNSLRGLAQQFGGDLTVNPHTGLPEAGWLGKLLPTILGGVLAATGVGAPLAAGLVGLGSTAITGDLKKGLMAGLGAFGGASLAGAAGLGGAISKNAFGVLGDKAGILGANMGAGLSTAPAIGKAAEGTLEAAFDSTFPGKTGIGGVIDKFGKTAARGLPGGIISKAAPLLAAQGLIGGVSNALTPTGGYTTAQGTVDNSYQGPYTAQRRTPMFAPSTADLLASTKERRYFDVGMPEVYNMQGQVVQPGSNTPFGTPIFQSVLNPSAKTGQPMYSFVSNPYMGGYGMGYAKGGEVEMDDGSFVVDARTVSELGNGSSNAGQELLAKMGGHPVKGPGDGVSDSIPARIGGTQPARVARDEVIFPAQAVKKLGGGSEKRGTQKLYAMMEKAHNARKRASRGTDTKLRKGLA